LGIDEEEASDEDAEQYTDHENEDDDV